MFTSDQNPGICRCNSFNLLLESIYGQRVAGEGGFVVSFLAQDEVFGFQAGKTQTVLGGKDYLVIGQRLFNKIESANFCCLHSSLDGAVP